VCRSAGIGICFRAEIQIVGQPVRVLGEFDLAPLEIIPSKLQAEWVNAESVVASWDPADEPDFLRLPSYLREDFATMVRQWGMVISVMFPDPAWLTIH
jgi:hypothetical protein